MIDTEGCCDMLTFLDQTYSGTNTPSEPVDVPTGMWPVLWASDFSVTDNGWSFKFVPAASSGEDDSVPDIGSDAHIGSAVSSSAQLTVPVSEQSIPDGASHLLVFSAYGASENSVPAAIEVVDYNPPTAVPQSVTFSDTNTSRGFLSGDIIIQPPETTDGILSYNVYWGSNSTQKIQAGASGLVAEYFVLADSVISMPDLQGLTATLTRFENTVNHPQTEAAWEGLGLLDNFAARWSGYLRISTPGAYKFYLASDDGGILYLDGTELINDDSGDMEEVQSATIQLDAG
eukprot:CAMPEP_0115277932 /NCGR_PEP_ID=MMETSP0270-20121206/57495_1 /TAXON_ID=71861 /ORGANISM="Scrippsiella trochoidea, Strain CCMP3099" /LENGTH=287 /DNA_ID=CAMNT_0002694589 /DNA_START=109 /DNA_END=968 /DNA_ORIENTATION=-